MSEADVRRRLGAAEDEWVMTCPACGSEQRAAECVMGTLGNRVHCRCRYCGMDFSRLRSRGRRTWLPKREQTEAVGDPDDGDDDLGPLDLPLPGDIGDEEGHIDYNQAVIHDLDHCLRCHGEIDADEFENNDGLCDECATDEVEEDDLADREAEPARRCADCGTSLGPTETEYCGSCQAAADADGEAIDRLESGVEDEKITLHDIEGIARKSGTDDDGNKWVQFEVDALADQEPGECSICGDDLESGWMCLDGGEEICDEHVDLDGGD